ncbi:DUF3291 domain-containing protein [Methylobacterium durans]|uniref:DUF3291 domain-containing protein n=1 Tax=Methylobacterium durans TaxID=2202825 RepID=UPI001AEC7BFF|nr:DUF3291 domain-containing protein [Methylobacterium durans]
MDSTLAPPWAYDAASAPDNAVPSISLTRLRLCSWRFLPGFVPLTLRSARQAERAPGFLDGAVLGEPARLTFWTLTAWTDEATMRAYMLSGVHRAAMPRLLDWCDEAAVARWEAAEAALPGWAEADRRLRELGRPSKVRHPSPAHAGLRHAPPSLTRGARLRPRG